MWYSVSRSVLSKYFSGKNLFFYVISTPYFHSCIYTHTQFDHMLLTKPKQLFFYIQGNYFRLVTSIKGSIRTQVVVINLRSGLDSNMFHLYFNLNLHIKSRHYFLEQLLGLPGHRWKGWNRNEVEGPCKKWKPFLQMGRRDNDLDALSPDTSLGVIFIK